MRKIISIIFLIFCVGYFLTLIGPAISNDLTGTFKPHSIPNDYADFNKFVENQDDFFRTLWIPTIQRYGYFSESHPAITGEYIFKTLDLKKQLALLNSPETEKLFQESGIKYVVVPFDSEGEIFLNDRKYDDNIYKSAVKSLEEITWLKGLPSFGKIKIFQVPNPEEHIWSPSKNLKLTYSTISPVEYKIEVKGVENGDRIVFSEAFDKNWVMKGSNFLIRSKPYDRLFNSFSLARSGSY